MLVYDMLNDEIERVRIFRPREYCLVWYDIVWYGMVWYDMVWYGKVWYGIVWYGMVYGRRSHFYTFLSKQNGWAVFLLRIVS